LVVDIIVRGAGAPHAQMSSGPLPLGIARKEQIVSNFGEYLTRSEIWLHGASELADIHTQPQGNPRSISYSTPSMEAVRRLLKSYDLESSMEGMLYHHGVNDTFFLRTPRRQFALKLYQAGWRTRAEVHEEVAAIRHCYAKGVHVAMPIERRDGEYVSSMRAPEGTRWAILFPWATGQEPTYHNAAHAHGFGRLVGQMHAAMTDFTPRGARPNLDLDYLLHAPVKLLKLHLDHLPGVAARLDALYARIESKLRRIGGELTDWGFCHGDVGVHNARFDGDELMLFDFDFCGQGWQVSDLATFRWQARTVGAEDRAWEAFEAGYLHVRPEARDSLQFIDLFMMIKHLWNQAHCLRIRLRNGQVLRINDAFLEDTVIFCEKLEAARGG
jgi:Ser/Thr protein kinase RdoA (MazF antagonist)